MPYMSRREFIRTSSKLAAAASLSGALGPLAGCSSSSNTYLPQGQRPNILVLMVDQMQTPPEGYHVDQGCAPGLKEILGFRPLSPDNPYAGYFPGLLRLRQNGVVLRKHYTASAASAPSRACIMTGLYTPATGVTQTDGLFKSATDVPWLDPDGPPTIGDWFRSVGYTTHYYGKWHVSDPQQPAYLEPWGFADWAQSYPEPHGGTAANAGAYRDVQFADSIEKFLSARGQFPASTAPWLAVGSLVNPHDCSYMPLIWEMPDGTTDGSGVVSWAKYQYPPPMTIPAPGDKSLPNNIHADQPLYQVPLNPDGFPQDNGSLPPTYGETLTDKPQCQREYALKWGLAFGAKSDSGLIGKVATRSPLPFQLQSDATEWSLKYNQFYTYLHYLMDIQLNGILQALDRSGQAGNTIIVFLSDHGEMTGAHGGMIQKWHSAYEEAVRVPMVVSSPLVNSNPSTMREITQPTSSIDLAPTLLSLAGFDVTQLQQTMNAAHGSATVQPFAGANLATYLTGKKSGEIIGPDGTPRTGVLFMTNDMITELGGNPSPLTRYQYRLFLEYVDQAIQNGQPLTRGPVCQPNNVRAFCTGDWKIVRYVDPRGIETDEWELYCLTSDPIERINLVDFRTGIVRDDVPPPPGMTKADLIAKNLQLRAELARQEAEIIG